MEEKKESQNYEVVLMSITAKAITANERLIRLSGRLGRLIPKFGKVDHSVTGLLPWIMEYQSMKDEVNVTTTDFQRIYNEILGLANTQKITIDASMRPAINTLNATLSRCYSKIEVLDDILIGLLEDIWDDVQFEATKKEEIKKAVKDTIEQTKEIPEGMYV